MPRTSPLSATHGNEELYRRIIETTHLGVCIADPDYRYTFANRRLCEMLGYEPDELVGMTVFAGVLGYESFWLGAAGWVAVCSNVIPRWSAELFELVADKRDMDAGLALYNKMTPLLWWVGGPRYVSGTKAAFEMMGMPMGPPRAPRLPLPEAQRPALRKVLQEMGVLPEEKKLARA